MPFISFVSIYFISINPFLLTHKLEHPVSYDACGGDDSLVNSDMGNDPDLLTRSLSYFNCSFAVDVLRKSQTCGGEVKLVEPVTTSRHVIEATC
jgi:hypothetical protein